MLDDYESIAWYAVRVFANHELSVARMLRETGFDEFLPTYQAQRKWCDRLKTCELPLFPGYVFSRFFVAERWRVIKLPGVIELVHFGNRIARIEGAEIERLRRVIAAGVPREPLSDIHIGEMVEIIRGPLAGLTGPVMQVRSELRLVLSITLLRRSVMVHVESRDIRHFERSEPKRIIVTPDTRVRRGRLA